MTDISERDAPSIRAASILAVFESPHRAEDAVNALQDAGFDTRKLSIAGRDQLTDEHRFGFATGGGQLRFWGRRGAFWERVSRLLPGVAVMFVPFLGHVVALGPVARVLVGDAWQETARNGDTSFSTALTLLGMPASGARMYESVLRADQIVLLVHGTLADAAKARDLLRRAAASRAA